MIILKSYDTLSLPLMTHRAKYFGDVQNYLFNGGNQEIEEFAKR